MPSARLKTRGGLEIRQSDFTMTNDYRPLTSDEIRALIDKYSGARLMDERVEELAERVGVSQAQVYRYLKDGVPALSSRRTRRELLIVAAETGVIESAGEIVARQ